MTEEFYLCVHVYRNVCVGVFMYLNMYACNNAHSLLQTSSSLCKSPRQCLKYFLFYTQCINKILFLLRHFYFEDPWYIFWKIFWHCSLTNRTKNMLLHLYKYFFSFSYVLLHIPLFLWNFQNISSTSSYVWKCIIRTC